MFYMSEELVDTIMDLHERLDAKDALIGELAAALMLVADYDPDRTQHDHLDISQVAINALSRTEQDARRTFLLMVELAQHIEQAKGSTKDWGIARNLVQEIIAIQFGNETPDEAYQD